MKAFITFLLCLLFALIGLSQWTLQNPQLCSSLDFNNDSTGVIAVNEPTGAFVLQTFNYGISWDTVFSLVPISAEIRDVFYASDSVLYLCGHPNLFRKSVDRGETWFDPTDGNLPSFNSIQFVSEQLGYASNGEGGSRVGVTYDGGVTWLINEEVGGVDINVREDCFPAAIVGSRYTHSNDCGVSWVDDTLVTENRYWQTTWQISADTILLGAIGGYGEYFDFNYGSIGRSINGGDSFSFIDIPYVSQVITIYFESSEIGYAGCIGFGLYPYSILKTTNGGITWGRQYVPLYSLLDIYPNIVDIDCPSPGYCYAAGTGVYRTMNGGGEIYDGWFVPVSSVETKSSEPSIVVFPNPAHETIQLGGISQFVAINCFNAQGQQIPLHFDQNIANTESLVAGVYSLHIQLENTTSVISFIKN